MLALLNNLILGNVATAKAAEVQISLDNIESRHIAIAISGMAIVFTALLLVSVAIAVLPKILDALDSVLPAQAHPTPAASQATTQTGDEEEVAAAIGMALHLYKQGQA